MPAGTVSEVWERKTWMHPVPLGEFSPQCCRSWFPPQCCRCHRRCCCVSQGRSWWSASRVRNATLGWLHFCPDLLVLSKFDRCGADVLTVCLGVLRCAVVCCLLCCGCAPFCRLHVPLQGAAAHGGAGQGLGEQLLHGCSKHGRP